MSAKSPAPNRFATAHWAGSVKEGQGQVSLGSGEFSGRYSFDTRFTVGEGTTPEELLAASHAACFTMATSAVLTGQGHTPESLDTEATVVLEMLAEGPTITAIHLEITGKVPGLTAEGFDAAASEAKAKCPLSRALAAVPSITLKASLA